MADPEERDEEILEPTEIYGPDEWRPYSSGYQAPRVRFYIQDEDVDAILKDHARRTFAAGLGDSSAMFSGGGSSA